MQAPGTFLLVEDTTELSWPEAAEHRAGLGPGKAMSQGVLLHSLVADRGAGIYEPLRQCHAQGLGFVVRAAQDRALVLRPVNLEALY